MWPRELSRDDLATHPLLLGEEGPQWASIRGPQTINPPRLHLWSLPLQPLKVGAAQCHAPIWPQATPSALRISRTFISLFLIRTSFPATQSKAQDSSADTRGAHRQLVSQGPIHTYTHTHTQHGRSGLLDPCARDSRCWALPLLPNKSRGRYQGGLGWAARCRSWAGKGTDPRTLRQTLQMLPHSWARHFCLCAPIQVLREVDSEKWRVIFLGW